MGRNKDPELEKKAELFLAKYAQQQDKKDVKGIATALRPELKPESASRWGQRILADPDSRKKLMQIEQGGIAKIYDILDDAVDTLAEFVRSPDTPKMVRIKAIDMVLRRVLGGIPDTVILNKFSIFDGEGQKFDLRELLRTKMETSTYERVIKPIDASVSTSEPEASEVAQIAEEG